MHPYHLLSSEPPTRIRGYAHDTYRRQLRARGITPRIARRGIDTARDPSS